MASWAKYCTHKRDANRVFPPDCICHEDRTVSGYMCRCCMYLYELTRQDYADLCHTPVAGHKAVKITQHKKHFFPGPSEKTSVCCRWMWSVSRSKHFWRRFWIEQYRTTKDPLGEARKDHPSEASSFRVRSAVLRQVRDTANSHKGDKGHWLAYLHNSLVAVR